ncbi:unnamed protein product [Arctia plantaginis]|uniref:Uncharacterized protein n=1 Tax=Arctia plantaginis TaxID=874455 RepID=A0A8S1B8G9_ARCPL|nr:unnamed protein product [Arctia plantaginis]
MAVTDKTETKQVAYRRASANEKSTTEVTIKSHDVLSVFSSWNIMSGQFKGGKVILPVISTPRPEYHLSFRTMAHAGRAAKKVKVTTAKIYTKTEVNKKSARSKNQYRKRKARKYLTFKEFIKRLGIILDNKPY